MSSHLPARTRYAVFQRDNWRCFYCGKDTGNSSHVDFVDNPTIDHVQPEHRGGTNDMDNLVTACHSCNKFKRHMTLAEYRRYVSRQQDGRGACQDHLRLALVTSETPFDKHIRKAIDWLESQMPDVVFWGEKEAAE